MDARDCQKAPSQMFVEDENGVEYELVMRLETCDVCEGKGTHVNPDIDRNGLTAEDFAEDPDFCEAYFRGDYDQTCNRCGGARTIHVVDRENNEPELLELYDEQVRAEYEVDAAAEAERRYFARFER